MQDKKLMMQLIASIDNDYQLLSHCPDSDPRMMMIHKITGADKINSHKITGRWTYQRYRVTNPNGKVNYYKIASDMRGQINGWQKLLQQVRHKDVGYHNGFKIEKGKWPQ